MTIMLTLNITGVVGMHDLYLDIVPWALLLVGAVGGVVGDLLLWWLKPSVARIRELRLFAALLPAALYALYFLAAIFTSGLWWSIHLWTGAIVLSGVTGWLVSHLVVPSNFERADLRGF